MKIFVNNLVAIFWSKQKIQSDGDGAWIHYTNYDGFAQVVEYFYWRNNMWTVISICSSTYGIKGSIPIGKKYFNGTP